MFWLGFLEVLLLLDKGLSHLAFQPDPLGVSPSGGEDIPQSRFCRKAKVGLTLRFCLGFAGLVSPYYMWIPPKLK